MESSSEESRGDSGDSSGSDDGSDEDDNDGDNGNYVTARGAGANADMADLAVEATLLGVMNWNNGQVPTPLGK